MPSAYRCPHCDKVIAPYWEKEQHKYSETLPFKQDIHFQALPKKERDRIVLEYEMVHDLYGTDHGSQKTAMIKWAVRLGCSFQTVSRHYYLWKDNGKSWESLANKNIWNHTFREVPTSAKRFAAYIEDLKRHKKLKWKEIETLLEQQWREKKPPIPGYEDWHGWPKQPSGWHRRNLSRKISPSKKENKP